MLRLLIDTSTWLDVAKDYRQQPVLGTLEHVVKDRLVSLILPRIIVKEFNSNKDRVARESSQSLSATFRRVRDAIEQFGPADTKEATLEQLHEVDHRLGTLGESVNGSISRIEALFAEAEIVEPSEAAKLAAVERAISGQAPFHKGKNSIGDALLIEIYHEAVAQGVNEGNQFGFVTHNIHDFSAAGSDSRLPHPDIAALFQNDASSYWVSLPAVLKEIAPDWLEDYHFEFTFHDETRRLSEIGEAINLFFDQVWYNRHWGYRIEMEEAGKPVLPVALQAAKRVEERRGLENLGPWTDFEWGMINGKLSALRWVLGDEWDFLDT